MVMTQHPEQVKHSTFWEIVKYVVSLLIVVAGVAVFIGLSSLAKPPATQESTALIPQVNVAQVQPYSGILDMMISGSVVPHREIKIAAEVGGRVVKKYDACEAGSFVTKGEKLVEIDQEEYLLEITTLEADVAQSEKRIEENKQQIAGERRNIELAIKDLEIEQNEYDRNRRLTGVLSQSEMDQALRALNAAKTQLTNRESNLATLIAGTARLEAARDLAESQLEKAKLNLRRTTISAPDDGIIVREMVQEGDYVSKGTQVATFEDTSMAEVLCNLTPSDLKWIQEHSRQSVDAAEDGNLAAVYQLPKTKVTLFDPSEPSVTWEGVLEKFDGIGRDEVTKTIPCLIVVKDPVVKTPEGPRALVRGMFVKCRVEVQTSTAPSDRELVSFPAVALQPNDHVWIVVDQKLKKIDIEVADRTEKVVGDETEQLIVARAGEDSIQAGDAIVVSPLSQPTEGSPVILKNGNEPETEEVDASVNRRDEDPQTPPNATS